MPVLRTSLLTGSLILLLFSPELTAWAQSSRPVRDFPLVTNVAQLRLAVSGNMGCVGAFSLTGTVLAVNPGLGTIFFQDDSGVEVLESNLEGLTLQPGQRIRLQGTNYLTATAIGVSLGKQPVIDNDGRHIESECTATLALKVGRYPITVAWFNGLSIGMLQVSYSGPNLARQPIPNARLFHAETTADGGDRFVPGLNYQVYEDEWLKLPPFHTMKPVKTGVASNFDMKVATRAERVGLTFDGLIEITTAGLYTFYLRSDDGSQLFLHDRPVQLTVADPVAVPVPQRIAIRQPLPEDAGPFWAEVTGRVTFLGQQQNRVELELSADDTHMRLLVQDESAQPPRHLLGSRVRVRGICLDTPNTGEHKLANRLVVSDWSQVQVLAVAHEAWLLGNNTTIKDCRLRPAIAAPELVRWRGNLRSRPSDSWPQLDDGSGTAPIELLNPLPPQFSGEVECLGEWAPSGGGTLRAAIWRALPQPLMNATNLPVLTTAAQVQQLNRVEAGRNYHAKIRGVVIWVAENQDCVVIQDATRGVFVGLRDAWRWETPKVGEILAIEGTCVAEEFSPIIVLNKGERLGMGQLPAPMTPTWDQLISGSMDSQYVEVRGLVTAARDRNLTLLMPGGKVEVEFAPIPSGGLESFVNSVVRIRGCMFAKWDNTLLVTPDHPLWFGSSTICVDSPPPVDPFDVDQRRAKELMQYDVQRNFFRQVKVAGQVLQGRARNYCLTDAGFGVRFQLAKSADFTPGDLVEVAGLVQLGGASPLLQEAMARKTGSAPLPVPQELFLDQTNKTYDLTRVWVEGLLVDARNHKSERVLEMQVGLKSFVARLPLDAVGETHWPVGSRLKLTGIYSDLDGDRPGRSRAGAFELLVDSPADIELVARPVWWTLNRLLTMIALLGAGLALAFIWISLLRRQVERRTNQLKLEISERKRVEQDRAIEQERSRIARDLHDDLGSSLTAIGMLAQTGRGKLAAEASGERLQTIADKTRLMVTTLDELVWAVNPKNDTVAALAEYLASFAEELLARTDIVCRVELPLDFPAKTIASETRHDVLLAVKEALTNAIRHGQCSEILLQLTLATTELEIVIRDNGCGFDPAKPSSGNGLANLQERMRKVSGRCEIQSAAGQGTTVALILPV